MAVTARKTRHERVMEILEEASGSGDADYGGAGRFWHLPIDQLEEVSVHGVRMIAPDDAQPGRGARSGLVRGLRGEAPFDGSRFPALPWGGRTVTEADIQFISDWIEDGLPADDSELASLPLEGALSLPELEVISQDNVESDAPFTHGVVVGGNEYAQPRGELKQRMNIDCMSESQIDEFRAAMRELYRFNKWPEDRRSYNNLAQIHLNHCQHGWERFLPWHRIYLYEFEQAMQDRVPGVTLPYWDWTMAHYMPAHPEKGSIIPEALKAFLSEESIEWLHRAEPKVPKPALATLREKMVGTRYVSQKAFFDDVTKYIGPKYAKGKHRERFIDALLDANSLWYPLRYPAEYTKGTINAQVHYHYPKPEDIDEILALRSFRDFGGGGFYNDSFGFLDQNPHNTMHIWTGGMNPQGNEALEEYERDMAVERNRGVRVAGRRFHTRRDMYTQPKFGDMFSNLTASYDPIFWPIHSNVDRLWSEWQRANPHALPVDLGAVLTPWSYTIEDTLDMSRFGYEYVKATFVLPVGLGAPVSRFVSRPMDIPDTVRGAFRQAEVRLHRVPQLERSGFVRVFLNLPDATASTPIDHPNYAGYLAIFGHGPCYGGPGHCDVPDRATREFDLRPRHHNTPRNHRITVTDAARRLLDAGATSLQITLVVIGADYGEDEDLLQLEGVSLNFLD
jgi:tyrosinase